MLELNRIYNEDCLGERGMRLIADKSVDLIVIDPPYNIGKDRRWDKWKTVESYVEWMGHVFKGCERVLKDNGSFYFFHNDFLQIVELQKWLGENTPFRFKQLITWNKIHERFKNRGFVQQRLSIDGMRNYYNGFTEYCLYYTFQDETGLEAVTEEYIKPNNPMARYLQEEIARSGATRRELSSLFPSRTGGLPWLAGCAGTRAIRYMHVVR